MLSVDFIAHYMVLYNSDAQNIDFTLAYSR